MRLLLDVFGLLLDKIIIIYISPHFEGTRVLHLYLASANGIGLMEVLETCSADITASTPVEIRTGTKKTEPRRKVGPNMYA